MMLHKLPASQLRQGVSQQPTHAAVSAGRRAQRRANRRTVQVQAKSGDASREAPADLGDWVVAAVDEITRGAGDAIKLRPLALGQGSVGRPEEAVAAVLEQADRLLAILHSLLTKNKATAGAMQQRVLDPLQAAISSLRSAVSGGTGLAVVLPEFQQRVAAALAELTQMAAADGSEDTATALQELKAFGGLVGHLVGLLFGGSASASASSGQLKVTSSLGFSATTPEEAVAALVVQAEKLAEALGGLLLQGASGSEMKLRVLQPLKASINAMRVAAKDGGGAAGLREAVFEFQARLSAAVVEVGRTASEQPGSAEAKATLAQLQAFSSGLTQLVSLFFGWGGAAGAGAGAAATPTRSASPALRMVANLDLTAASSEEAATALLVVAEEILAVVRRLLLQGPSASEMKLRVLQPLQASINATRSAAKNGGGAGLAAAAPQLQACLAAAKAEVAKMQKAQGLSASAELTAAVAQLDAFEGSALAMVRAVLTAAGVQAPQSSAAGAGAGAGSAAAHQLPDLNKLDGASPDEVVAAMQQLTAIAASMTAEDSAAADKAIASVRPGSAGAARPRRSDSPLEVAAGFINRLLAESSKDGSKAAPTAAAASVAAQAAASSAAAAAEQASKAAAQASAAVGQAAGQASAALSAQGGKAAGAAGKAASAAAGTASSLTDAGQSASSAASKALDAATAAASQGQGAASSASAAAADAAAAVGKAVGADSSKRAKSPLMDFFDSLVAGSPTPNPTPTETAKAAAQQAAGSTASSLPSGTAAAAERASAAAASASASAGQAAGQVSAALGSASQRAADAAGKAATAAAAAASSLNDAANEALGSAVATPDEAVDALVTRAEAVVSAVRGSLAKADAKTAAALQERVLSPLQDTIDTVKGAYRMQDGDGPDVEDLMQQFQARLSDVGDEVAQLTASSDGKGVSDATAAALRDLQGTTDTIMASFGSLAAQGSSTAAGAGSGSTSRSAAPAKPAASPLGGLLGGLFGGSSANTSTSKAQPQTQTAVSAFASGAGTKASRAAASVADKPASADEAVDAMVTRAEAVVSAVRGSLAKADAKTATALQERVLSPLQDTIDTIKGAYRMQDGDGPDVEDLMQQFQARLSDVGDEVAQLTASSDGKGGVTADIAASLKDLQETAKAAAQQAAGSTASSLPSGTAAAAERASAAAASASASAGQAAGQVSAALGSASQRAADAAGKAATAAAAAASSLNDAANEALGSAVATPDEAVDALVTRAEAVVSAVRGSLAKADAKTAAALQERVLSPLQDTIDTVKGAYRMQDGDGPDVEDLMQQFQARLSDVGDEVAQLTASSDGKGVSDATAAALRDLQGTTDTIMASFGSLAAQGSSTAAGAGSGSTSRSAAPAKPAASPLGGLLGGLFGGSSANTSTSKAQPQTQTAVSAFASGAGTKASRAAASVADKPASADEAVDAMVTRAEAVVSAVRGSLAKADAKTATALQERVLSPLQDTIDTIKGAYRMQDGDGPDVEDLMQQFQARLSDVGDEVAQLTASSDGKGGVTADIAASLKDLQGTTNTLVASLGSPSGRGSLASAAAVRLEVSEAADKLSSALAAKAGAGTATQAEAVAAVAKAAPAGGDAVAALLARAESTAASVKASVAAAARKDPAAGAALEKQLVAPLQAQVAALKAATAIGKGAGTADLATLVPQLQASLIAATGRVSKLGASSDPELARVMDSLAAELAPLTAAAQGLSASLAAAPGGVEDAAVAAGKGAGWFVASMLGVGAMQAIKAGVDVALADLGVASAIPSAVISMLGVSTLLALSGPVGDKLVAIHDSAIAPWTTDLLGLFYVPAVAIMPVLLQGITGADLQGLLGVTAGTTALTLLLTARAASLFASSKAREAAAAGPGTAPAHSLVAGPAGPVLLSLSALAAAVPLALTRNDPLGVGASMALPVGVASSVFGYLAGRVLLKPKDGSGSGWLSPVLLGALAANAGVAFHANELGSSWLAGMSAFYAGNGLGAGEVLAAPLGAALTSLGFLIYKHRAAISLPAVLGASLLSTAFSVLTAAGATQLLGVNAEWARALIPRSVTSSVAVDMANALGAPTECAGLAVLLQAAMAVAGGKLLLKLLHRKLDPAAEGVAAGTTAGLMGAAGIAGGSPTALASGALAYACMAVLGAAIVNAPAVVAAMASAVV